MEPEIKEKNLKIIAILRSETIKPDDVSELMHISMTMDSVISNIIQRKISPSQNLSYRIFQRGIQKLDGVIVDYLAELQKLNSSGKLEKVLSSASSRANIEQLASTVMVELNMLEEKFEYLLKELNVAGVRKEELHLTDPDAKKMWETELNGKVVVEWSKFAESLGKAVGKKMTEEQRKALKYILDSSNTGLVSSYKFNEFLKAFRPFKECLANVDSVLREKYFHGFLTLDEARKFLEYQPEGSFLMRFSSSKPASFALAYNLNGKVNHVMIATTDEGFSIKEDNVPKIFSDVKMIVSYYSNVLQVPFDSTIPEEPWFHGDITAQEAEDKLRNRKVGSFIIRFSSQPGHFAASYVDKIGVGKLLIGTTPGFHIKDHMEPKMFPTLREMIADFPEIFKYGYSRFINEVNNNTRKKIASELADTERSYVKSLTTMITQFYNPLLAAAEKPKSFASVAEINSIFSNCKDLLDLHHHFSARTDQAMQNFSEETELGPHLIELNNKLFIYREYINFYNRAIETYQRLLKVPAFKKFIDGIITGGQVDQSSVDAYLIAPVQRIPRYILLLSDLIKHTNEGHVDHDSLRLALDEIKKTADKINEEKRNYENMEKLQHIQANLKGDFSPFAVTGRFFVKSFNVLEKVKSGFKEREITLMNDMLLHVTKKKDKAEYESKTILTATTPIIDLPDSKSEKNAFKVGDVVFSASTPQEKITFMRDIEAVINKLKPGGNKLERVASMHTTMNNLLLGNRLSFSVNSPKMTARNSGAM